MRTRWEEDSVVAQGHHRKFSILPLALGMAVPVAFIAGAAITSYISMEPEKPAQSEVAAAGQGSADTSGLLWTLDEQKRCAVEVETARTDLTSLKQQIETLQSQIIVATREKEEADRKVASALAGKAAAEAEAARAVTAAASEMSDRLASASAAASGGSAVSALAEDKSTRTPALESISGSVAETEAQSNSAGGITGTSVSEPQPNSSFSGMTAAVTETPPELSSTAGRSLTPRSALAVSDVLGKAPGLSGLSEASRSDLEARLVRGECVSSSLASAFNNHVPVVPLRDLIRNLDSDC